MFKQYSRGMDILLRCLIVLLVIALTKCLSMDEMYPFGSEHGDMLYPGTPVNITFPFPVKLFGKNITEITLDDRGIDVYSPELQLTICPTGAFLSDEETIWYNVYTKDTMLEKASEDIWNWSGGMGKFNAKFVLVQTWDHVKDEENPDLENTYQYVLISDGQVTMLVFNFYDIQWNADDYYNLEFVADDGNMSMYFASNEEEELSLPQNSNIGKHGLYVYRFDGVQMESPVTDDCVNSKCKLPGGKCEDGVNDYTCECNPGYQGPDCQDDINECESSPCINGICENKSPGFKCICQFGHSGNLCKAINYGDFLVVFFSLGIILAFIGFGSL